MLTKEQIVKLIHDGEWEENDYKKAVKLAKQAALAIDLAAEVNRLKAVVEFVQEWVDHQRPWIDDVVQLAPVDKVLWQESLVEVSK